VEASFPKIKEMRKIWNFMCNIFFLCYGIVWGAVTAFLLFGHEKGHWTVYVLGLYFLFYGVALFYECFIHPFRKTKPKPQEDIKVTSTIQEIHIQEIQARLYSRCACMSLGFFPGMVFYSVYINL
jgi:hypothetical protein